MAWTTPGTAVAGDVLTAARWNTDVRDNTLSLARGIVARATITNSQNTTSASPVDVTNATVTWTAESNRLYKVSFTTYMTKFNAAGNVVLLITDGSNVQKQNRDTYFDGATTYQHGFIWVVETGLSGSITRKIRFATSTSSVTIEGGTLYPSQLIVEDCGLA